MGRILPYFAFVVLLAGCSAYKELSPDPEVLPQERGYIELKDGDKYFNLDRDGKYYIVFPPPAADNFVLVLRIGNKPAIGAHLTSRFDNGDFRRDWIRDEAAGSDSLSVFAVDTKSPMYFWVIDTVRTDVQLVMVYRYAPRWRYTFDTRYAVLQRTFLDNTVERKVYESIGPGFSFEGFDFSGQKAAIAARTERLRVAREELAGIGSLFPQEVVSRGDTAYRQYTALTSSIDDELRFQEDYGSALRVFELEQESRGNSASFVKAAPVFADFFSRSDHYRKAVEDHARELVIPRLSEIAPFYEDQLRSKTDAKPIVLRPPLDGARKLYSACSLPLPDEIQTINAFVERFNLEAAGLEAAQGRIAEAEKSIQGNPSWLSEQFYSRLMEKMDGARSGLLDSQLGRFPRQRGYPSVTRLNQEVGATRETAFSLQGVYSRARDAVGLLNVSSWGEAEVALRDLSGRVEFSAIPTVRTQRDGIVAHLESEFFSRVRRETEARVDAFIEKNRSTTDKVAALYADSAFLPMYQFTFSAAGPATVQQRNKGISDYLSLARHIRFPEAAIKPLYQEFVRDIFRGGAEKARAIVEHGKEYQGTDKDVRAYISECDPAVPKTIARAKEYRRIYVIPETDNRRGTNDYMFRLRLRIPTEARFPVYDVTMKLPKEIAERAGKEQWYQTITIDRKPIKNEGRYRITAPGPENNYESLITPVQTDREGNSVLEVRFRYPGYRAFEVSAMAQVPIIRKN